MKWAALFFVVLVCAAQAQEHEPESEVGRRTVSVPLSRGPWAVYDLPPSGTPSAVLVFVSGANGWSYWEDVLCRHLARKGLYVLGLDWQAYAATPVTPENLASDLERIAEAAAPMEGAENAPIWYGGDGAGAAQALLAALPPMPHRLAGLLVVDPAQRGCIDLGPAQRLGLSPHGAGSFPLAEKAALLERALRVAAVNEPDGWFTSTAWLAAVPGPHQLFPFTQGLGHFHRVDQALLGAVDAAVAWLLHS